jgi:hypothetical protein
MNPDTRRRLVGVLGLLASNHDGERAAAGLLATRILKTANVTWESLIPERPLVIHKATHPAGSVGETFRADFDLCRRRPDLLTAWERTFLESVAPRMSLSKKQMDVMRDLFARVRIGAGR